MTAHALACGLWAAVAVSASGVAGAQTADSAATVIGSTGTSSVTANDRDATPGAVAADARTPLVPGGYDDKPYLKGVFGRILVGGYTEAVASWERVDGATEELGFEVARWNLFTSTRISSAVTAWAELEIEEGGEEVRLELAQIDVRLREAFQVRAGVLLLPLGRFNLAHDAPRNAFVERPLAAVELHGVTLSQPGLGAFGSVAAGGAVASYEAYAVNGFTDGVVFGAAEGTRLSAGRTNFEDDNASPAVVGRLALGTRDGRGLGVSGYHGAYNVFRRDGLVVDRRRDVAIGAVDLELSVAGFVVAGEGTIAHVQIPVELTGLYASRQAGFHLDLSRRFAAGLMAGLPSSSLTAAVRAEAVDFDRDLDGDSRWRLSAAFDLRPTDETVLKFVYSRGRGRDRFNNPSEDAALSLGVASYF